MTEPLTWAEEKVAQSAGFRLEDITPEISEMVKIALERGYYIDVAANELLRMLNCRPVYRGL